MKKTIFIFMLMIITLWLAGCEKETNTSLISNEAEINEMITNDNEEYFEDDFGFIDSENSADEGSFISLSKEESPGKLTTNLLDVFKFGRIVNRDSMNRIVEITTEGDTTFVHVETDLQGRFIILEKLDDNGDTLVKHIKALKHYVVKNAIYVKKEGNNNGNGNKHRRRWRMHKLSGGVGHSPDNTVSITEIKVASALTGQEYVYTDLLNQLWIIPDNLPIFPRGDEVTVTVTVENTSVNPVYLEDESTESVFLHHGMRPRVKRSRSQLDYIGDDDDGNKMYQNTWSVNRPELLSYHAVIDVIDNGTIFMADEEIYPYNSMTWGFPYKIQRGNGQ